MLSLRLPMAPARPATLTLQTAAGPSTRYVSRVIDFASHPEFAVLRRALPDGARIRFNHAKHLPPAGLPGSGGKAVALKCASCHQPTPDGRSMGPISFRAHCAGCHWNTLSYDVARFRDLGVPHGVQPELLRGLIRERYTQFIHNSPGELKGDMLDPDVPIPGLADRYPSDSNGVGLGRAAGRECRPHFVPVLVRLSLLP